LTLDDDVKRFVLVWVRFDYACIAPI
jgi:hypothetical protein